jgi:hypothetical protein
MTTAAMIIVGSMTGAMASTVNPFSIGVASGEADVSIGDGIGLRLLLWGRPDHDLDRVRRPLRQPRPAGPDPVDRVRRRRRRRRGRGRRRRRRRGAERHGADRRPEGGAGDHRAHLRPDDLLGDPVVQHPRGAGRPRGVRHVPRDGGGGTTGGSSDGGSRSCRCCSCCPPS